MADRVEIEIEVLAKKAIASVETFTKTAQKQLSSINISSLFAGAAGALSIAEKAIGAVSGAISTVTNAAIEAEESASKLANSMKLVGGFTQQAFDEMQDFASALSKTTLLSDDQVSAGLALAKSFTLTNQEARNVVKAAVELSAITGDSLSSSVEKLAKTYNGFISRELKQLVPELNNVTKAQLENGKAIDLVSAKFSGSAAAQIETFGGALSQLKKSFGELIEEIGKFITNSTIIRSAIGFISQKINELSEDLASLRVAIDSPREAFNNLFNSLDKFSIPVLLGLRKSINQIDADAEDMMSKIKTAARLGQQAKFFNDNSENEIISSRKLIAFKEKAEEEFQRFRQESETIGLSEIEKINIDAERKIKIIRDAARASNPDAIRNQESIISRIRIDQEKKVRAERKKTIQELENIEEKVFKDRRDKIEKSSKEPFTEIVNILVGKVSAGNVGAIGVGIVNSALKGVEGARSAISSALGAIADSILPGIGSIASEIFSVLSQGPDKVRQTVTEFARAIPQIIENVIKSIPVLIESLVRELPPALARAMPLVAQKFSIELIKNMPSIVRGFAAGLLQAAKEFGKAIVDFITSAGGILPSGGGGVGGAGIPIISDIADIFGFADGGRVPDLPRFEGDRFPARLNAGEQVLSKDLSSRLENFLNSGGSGQNMAVNLVIGNQQLAKVLLDINRKGFRTA